VNTNPPSEAPFLADTLLVVPALTEVQRSPFTETTTTAEREALPTGRPVAELQQVMTTLG
jgi:hypothetical protein